MNAIQIDDALITRLLDVSPFPIVVSRLRDHSVLAINDATAALIAKQLHAKGVAHVRPLAGGLDAWLKNGGLVEGLA